MPAKTRRRRPNLIRCDFCGNDAFVCNFDDAFVYYECAGPSHHAWTEKRDLLCVRCAESLSQHLLVVSSRHGSALVCPGVLAAHTFSPTN